MKKMLLKFAVIGGLALSIISCSNDADYSDAAKFASAADAAKSSKVVSEDVEAASTSATMYSDLNPGYGYAVYFAGTFKGNWGTAYRGTYSAEDGWTLTVETDDSFEWKALTGSYDLGETVGRSFAGLRYLGTTPVGGSITNPSWYSNAGYGNALYFVGNDEPTEAVRGVYVTDHWTCAAIGESTSYDVYIGKWDLGYVVNSTFEGLTWETGDNNVYEYDGHNGEPDGVVTRRALLISNIDGGAVCLGTIEAMTNAFNEQVIDGEKFAAVEMNTDLTLKQISEKVKTFFADTDDDDVSYVFFNCHGGSSGSIAIGTNGSMNGAGVRTLLDKYVRGEVVFIIESCHSGNIIGRGLAEDTFAENFISKFKAEESDSRRGELVAGRFHVICSSSMTQLSWTWGGVVGFASQFWSDGLGWNSYSKSAVDLLADADNNSKVTLKELYEYSLVKVNEEMDRAFTDGTTQTVVVYPDNDEFVIGGRF